MEGGGGTPAATAARGGSLAGDNVAVLPRARPSEGQFRGFSRAQKFAVLASFRAFALTSENFAYYPKTVRLRDVPDTIW